MPEQFEQLKQILATVMQNKQLMALVSAEWQKMKQPQGIGHPDAYMIPKSVYGDPDAEAALTAQLVAKRAQSQRNLGGLPEEYQAQLPMPSQKGTKPKTPHPLESTPDIAEKQGIPQTDSGMSEAYEEALMQELLRKKIPGHLYEWMPRVPPDKKSGAAVEDDDMDESPHDPYRIDPGKYPPLGGANKGWYPGSGPIDRNDVFGGPEGEAGV